MPDLITAATTPLDALEGAFDRAATYNERSRVAPAAILWPDEKEEWTRLLPRLRERLPQLLTLGDYDPETKTGPAIWIRCMIARTVDAADGPEEATPIVHLPGVSRQDIRAIERCPDALQPLAELQFRGTLWTQANGRDWTVRAFLVSEDGGLGLDVAADAATHQAMQRALPELADTPLNELRGRRLNAQAFRRLVAGDPVRDLLTWLDRPEEIQAEWSGDRWATFCEICRDEYDFHPEQDGPLDAARRLGFKEGSWRRVWQRYVEAPRRYPNLPDRLRRARPPQTGDLFAREPTWPQDNEALEDDLRQALLNLDDIRPDRVSERIAELDEQHAERRSWPWADLDGAPLATALQHLASLAEAVQSPVGGSTPDAVAESYRDGGWKADAAVLRALDTVRDLEDVQAVATAVTALYRTWLERGAEALQDAITQHGVPSVSEPPEPSPGVVLLFADALRYDVAQRLLDALTYEGLGVDTDWHWAALPTVTPTAKPAVSPIARELDRSSSPDEFAPSFQDGEARVDIRRFRRRMEDAGHQILEDGDTGDPSGTAWTEIGTLDTYGHNEEWRLARRIEELLREITARVRQLLDAGWSSVRIVTDHGWLLLPGDLPKETLPHYLAETRWGRCASLKEEVKSHRLTVPWHWNPDVRIAMAPGIQVHRNGIGYAHGGISVQECVVPRITVRRGDEEVGARVASVEWLRLRCRVQVEHPSAGLRVDLRRRVQDPASTVALKPKPVKEDGSVSLAVPDVSNEGEPVHVVLLDDETVIHTHSTTVGRDE